MDRVALIDTVYCAWQVDNVRFVATAQLGLECLNLLLVSVSATATTRRRAEMSI